MIIRLTAGQINDSSLYFPKLYESYRGNVTIELDLSNYATKADLKGATGIDKSNLATKSDLPSLKVEVDKIGIGKLKIFPTDLSKLSNVVDDDVCRKLGI